ncbi:cytochrome P450 [Auriscalpium vulgare]|uniref:Cytochrome P450 n=1 Tax=Auriscalpium vulgare TaxID=40419 RepID=A0ACB8S7A6_9AGAM|nr:cytochrome P450 [Auriscalpium vulgare]
MALVWSTLGALLGALLLRRLVRRYLQIRSLACVPGPRASRLWGNAFDVRGKRVGTQWEVWRRKYGGTYKLHEPLMEPRLVLGDPKAISYVLNANVANYLRPELERTAAKQWFGNTLSSAEDDEHRRMRKQLGPAFTAQSVQQVSHVFFDLAHELKAEWDDTLVLDGSSTVDVSRSLHALSLNAISRTMFAHALTASSGLTHELNELADLPAEDNVASRIAMYVLTKFPALLKLPTPISALAARFKAELDKIAMEVWDKEGAESGMDARLIKVLKEPGVDGAMMPVQDVIAQLSEMIFAGTETVANVMGELLYELAQQPNIQEALRNELLAFERAKGHMPAYADLVKASGEGLRYLDAVVREALRTKAVLMDLSRVAGADDVIPLWRPLPGTDITSIHIKAGTFVSISVREGVNVDPEIWGHDAADFKPERWLEVGEGGAGMREEVRAVKALGNVLSFGDGPKNCIGRHFALAELKASDFNGSTQLCSCANAFRAMQIVLSTLVRHFTFTLDPEVQIDFYHMAGGNTVKPKVRGKESEGVQLPLRVGRVDA